MILEAETIKRTGIAPSALSPGSKRLVAARCDGCSKPLGANTDQPGFVIYRTLLLNRRKHGTDRDYCARCLRAQRFPYSDEAKALACVRRLAGELGRTPKKAELPRLLQSQIAHHHGNYERFMLRHGFVLPMPGPAPGAEAGAGTRLGRARGRKPQGFWQSWDNLKAELEPLCAQLGRMPTYGELEEEGLGYLLPHFGGIEKVAQRMGYERLKVCFAADGHSVFSYFELVTDNILYSSGVPHKREPRLARGCAFRGDFLVGDTFIECLGYDPEGRKAAKDARARVYLERWQRKLATYQALKSELIVLVPDDFRDGAKEAKRKLAPVIERFSTGSTPKLNDEDIVRPIGFYAEWKNIEADLLPICRELGRFPRRRELELRGRNTLSVYISKYHGGSHATARRIGYPLGTNPHRSLMSRDYVVSILRPICDRLGRMPTAGELRSKALGVRTDIVTAIFVYHGGLACLAREMGVRPAREVTIRSKYRDLDYIVEKIRPAYERLGRLPTAKELRAGMHDVPTGLVNAIYGYHGGMGAVARALKAAPSRHPHGALRDESYVIGILRPIAEELGRMPTAAELASKRFGPLTDITTSIYKYHRSLAALATKMGVPLKRAAAQRLRTRRGPERSQQLPLFP